MCRYRLSLIKNFLILGIVLIFVHSIGSSITNGKNGKTIILHHRISIELFPMDHRFEAVDELIVKNEDTSIALNLNKNFEVESVKLDGKEITFKFDPEVHKGKSKKLDDDSMAYNPERAGTLTIEAKSTGELRVHLTYKGLIYEEPMASQFSRQYIANRTTGIISKQGTFLSPDSFWYPQGDEDMTHFEVKTITPTGYETITQGTRVSREISQNKLNITWKNNHPSDSLFLQAGEYNIQEDEVEGIKILTYFFPGDNKLSSLYLEKSKKYIAMYNQLLGKYPYEKFAVVENFFETGYGMPSWTLLGRTVLRLPFIPDISLPHEICHNWWGNGVFVDYSQGNWCEGLTVYCADYLLRKRTIPDGDKDYRRQINRDYASYVKKNSDFPLTEFPSRHDPATRAVGYGKAMMVYHQLKLMVGKENFFNSLRRLLMEYKFKKATWKNVLEIFEKECRIYLDDFYSSWIKRSGAPALSLENVNLRTGDNSYAVSFQIVQEGEPYNLDVPVLVKTQEKEFHKSFWISKKTEEFEIIVDSKPVRLEIDSDHHLFRRLFPQEIPPSIAKVLGSEKQLIVIPSQVDVKSLEKFRTAAQMINKTKTGLIKNDTEVISEELETNTLILFGSTTKSATIKNFLGNILRKAPWEEKLSDREDSGSVVVLNHPINEEYAVMVIDGKNKSDILSIARKLPHYGKYSYLLFHGDTNVAKGIWEVESSPLIHVFE